VLSDAIDAYCERTDASFWSEPLNALTNIAFFVAAWFVWRQLVRQRAAQGPHGDGDLVALTVLIALVGAGSLAFHTFGTRWGMLLDTGFITLFLLTYVQRFAVRRLGWKRVASWAAVVGFVALDLLLKRLLADAPLNGSQFYAAAFVVLLGMAGWARWRRQPGEGFWLLAALVFLLSVTLRSLDESLCAVWPMGTHFCWHLLNALVLWASMRALMALPANRTSPGAR